LSIFVGLFLLFAPILLQSASFPPEIKLMTWNVLNDNDLNSTRGQSVLSILEKVQADVFLITVYIVISKAVILLVDWLFFPNCRLKQPKGTKVSLQ
jgi:hypothetical protein